MSHFTPDDITFELLILKQLAAQPRPFWRESALTPPLAACLRSSSFWVQPPVLKAPVRSTSAWKAAALAGMIAIAPLGWLPVYAESTLRIGMSVIDARTGKPLTDAKVVNEQGALLGVTGSDGKIILNVPLSTTQRLTIEKPGYRSFPVIRTQLRDNNLIAMVPAQPSVAVTATPAPVATPQPVAMPHVPTPKPTPVPTPKPTAKPSLVSTPKPPVATAKPAPRVVPTPEVSPKGEAPKPGTAPSPKSSRYVVRHGDSLWAIAKREYGDATRWKVLYEVNQPPVRKAHLLLPGMVLKLPQLAQLEAGARGGMTVVRQGDCLWLIAERKLGNGERWREIYRLNRRKVRNPRLIHPGQRLSLPPR